MPALAADLEYCPAVNFAVQQSLLTYIQKITIRNLTNSRIDNVWFTLSFEPQFAENISIEIGPVMPGQVIEIDREYIDVKLSFDFLVGLTERIKGYNVIDIYSGETLVYHEKYDVFLLALEECPVRMSPELVAAFVMPNHPVLTGVLRKASEKIDAFIPDLSGYQRGGAAFVRIQMAGIYMALKDLEITYVSAPPSFFKVMGQRIRLLDDVVTGGLGTCLDTSILFASCLEAIDLNPLIILVDGHAFVGCLLERDACREARINDINILRNLYHRNLIEFVETTLITKGKTAEYKDAVEIAAQEMFEEDFKCALNIKELRNYIQPLPQRVIQEYWNDSSQLLTPPPDRPAELPDNSEIPIYNGDIYYIYMNDVIYGPYLFEQMIDLPLLPDTLITTTKLGGEWYEARNFECFADKFR